MSETSNNHQEPNQLTLSPIVMVHGFCQTNKRIEPQLEVDRKIILRRNMSKKVLRKRFININLQWIVTN